MVNQRKMTKSHLASKKKKTDKSLKKAKVGGVKTNKKKSRSSVKDGKKTKKSVSKRWSQPVTTQSHALSLEEGVFTWKNPGAIARSLKRSADHSQARKAGPYQSAMSMLNFYINRAGHKLPAQHKEILEVAKIKLKALYKK